MHATGAMGMLIGREALDLARHDNGHISSTANERLEIYYWQALPFCFCQFHCTLSSGTQ
jgi:hypothetical protein